MKKEYYSFSKEQWRFIFLNGLDISLIGNLSGSIEYKKASIILKKLEKTGAAGAKPWNGTLGKQQIKWLKKELREAKRRDQQIVVLCHYPLYPENSPQILWNGAEIREILETDPNVKAYFNGHVHISQYFKKNGVNYISFRGMVEGEENSFAIVSVYKDSLVVKGFGKEIGAILK
jgi:3',5'-cyclic AMP phosphodiesterase CpdA